MLKTLKSIYKLITSRPTKSVDLKRLYRDSKVRLIYKTTFGVSTYVHPEKILDILKTNSACDAEPWILSLSEILPPLGISLDVGANIGLVSCWLSGRSVQVYSFEPDSSNRKFLQDNVTLNNAKNIEIVPFAVGLENGLVDFCIRESFGHHGIRKEHITKTVGFVKVPIVSLDSFCAKNKIEKISFLKIDVEGNEIEVLRGFEGYLAANKVDLIVFEHAPVLQKTHGERIEVFDLLSAFGYSVYNVEHKRISREQMLREGQGDFYAKRP